jgi:hypothetical protein
MVWIPQERFSFGELSPRILGMGTSDQVRHGCKTLTNGVLTKTGGVRRRPGIKHIDSIEGNVSAYLVPYTATDGDYLLVFTHAPTNKLFVYKDEEKIDWGGGGTHGPYAASGDDTGALHPLGGLSANAQVSHFQHNNRVYIFTEDTPPLYFEKKYGSPPTYEFGIAPIVGGSPQLKSYKPKVGISMPEQPISNSGYTGMAAACKVESTEDLFSPEDVGSIWRLGGGSKYRDEDEVIEGENQFNGISCWFRMEVFNSPTTFTGRRITNGMGEDPNDWTGPYIPDTTWAGCSWSGGNRGAFVTLSNIPVTLDNSYVGRVLTVRRGLLTLASLDTAVVWIHSIDTVANTALCYNAGWSFSGTVFPAGTYDFVVTKIPKREKIPEIAVFPRGDTPGANVVSGNFDVFSETADFLPSGHESLFDGTGGVATLGGAVFASGARSRCNARNGAYDYQCIEGTARGYYGPTFNWGYGFSVATGYPAVGASHQGRVVMSGFQNDYQNIIASSRSGDPDDWEQGPNDDQGLLFKISNNVGNRIRWMVSQQDLLIGSDFSEYKLSGQPLTTTNLSVDLQSQYGSNVGSAAHLGSSLAFIPRGGQGIREMAYTEASNRYQSVDLTDLSDHIFSSGKRVKKIVFSTSPDPLLFVVSNQQSLDIMTYNRQNGVIGWSPTNLNSLADIAVKDIAVLSSLSGTRDDSIYMVMSRVVDGDTQYSLEAFTESAVLDSQKVIAGSGTTITGLTHLVGETVQVLVDAYYYIGEFVVSASGTVDISSAVPGYSTATVGLPFTFTMAPAVIEVEGRAGATHGHKRSYDRALLYLNNTTGAQVDKYALQGLPWVSGPAPVGMSGWQDVSVLGLYGTSPTLNITHNNPYTIEMQSISIEVSYSD